MAGDRRSMLTRLNAYKNLEHLVKVLCMFDPSYIRPQHIGSSFAVVDDQSGHGPMTFFPSDTARRRMAGVCGWFGACGLRDMGNAQHNRKRISPRYPMLAPDARQETASTTLTMHSLIF